jgi:hypothetical protein
MLKISLVQSNILLALAEYKFLTASQLHRLGVGKDIAWIRSQAKEMTEGSNPFIERITFPILPRQGRVESVFYLTVKGKESLIEGLQVDEKNIKLPIGKSTLFQNDYAHRKHTIDFQIQLTQWVQHREKILTMEFFDRYFDKIGNNRTLANLQSKNKIIISEEESIIPDGVFLLHTKQRAYLYLFEMYNGKDTKRVLEQVKKHAKALALGSASEKYHQSFSHKVILFFEFETMKKMLLERTKNDPYFNEVAIYFRCKSRESTELDFFKGWETLDGESVNLW